MNATYSKNILSFVFDSKNALSIMNATGTAISPAESFAIMPRPMQRLNPISFKKDFFSSLYQMSAR